MRKLSTFLILLVCLPCFGAAVIPYQQLATNQFKLSKFPHVEINLNQSQFDINGTSITITNVNSTLTNYFNSLTTTNYFLLGGTNILVTAAVSGTNVDFTIDWIPIVDTMTVTNLTVINLTNNFQTNVSSIFTNLFVTNTGGGGGNIYINGTNVLESYDANQFTNVAVGFGGLTNLTLHVKPGALFTNLQSVGLIVLNGEPYYFPPAIPPGGGLLLNPVTNLNSLEWRGSSTDPINQTIYFSTNVVIDGGNLMIGGWSLIITNASPSDPPPATNAPTLWINTVTSQSWVWDLGTLSWVAINPSFNTGMYTAPSVVELRMIHDNGVLQWATTWGNLAPGDGQGRRYWWSAFDTRDDDGIAVIKPDEKGVEDPGRWDEE